MLYCSAGYYGFNANISFKLQLQLKICLLIPDIHVSGFLDNLKIFYNEILVGRPVSSASDTLYGFKLFFESRGFNVKFVSPAYITLHMAQDFRHILDVFLVGV